MAKKINVIFIAFVLLGMVCITTQKKNRKQAKCNRLAKNFKKLSCEPEIPVDGVWEEWTETSTCTVTCGGGSKLYSRKCIKPQRGGKGCEGDASKIGSCGEQKCPVTLKQCDNLVTAVRNVKIPWNPDSETITVTTESVAGSEQLLSVWFLDKDGGTAGCVLIKFYTQIKYWLGWCMSDVTTFPVTLPTSTQKTWIFTYDYAEKRVQMFCNGVQVLSVVLSDSVCTRSTHKWIDYWERKPTQIDFKLKDDASDSYCISSKPGTI